MKTYNYLENVKEDVRNYIEENKIVVTSSNREEVEQELNDTLFVKSYLEKGAEACDVTIRCYLLGQAISEVLDEVEE